jgi:nitrite reductase/ring-hydroxylating ferredoxin subunit
VKLLEIAKSTDVEEGKMFLAQADALQVILTRVEGRAYAVENKCAHLGWSMARGSITGSTIQCPWHGSKFDVCSGENLDWVHTFAGIAMPHWSHGLIALGKQPAPIQTFELVEESGQISISMPT